MLPKVSFVAAFLTFKTRKQSICTSHPCKTKNWHKQRKYIQWNKSCLVMGTADRRGGGRGGGKQMGRVGERVNVQKERQRQIA